MYNSFECLAEDHPLHPDRRYATWPRQMIRWQFILGLLLCSMAAFVVGCERAPPPPPPPAGVPCAVVYVAESRTLSGEGRADDGEDVINAAGGVPYGPTPVLPASAADGAANATSDAAAFDDLKVKVTARKRITAGRRQPKTFARTIGASDFTVAARIQCQFQIDSNAMLTLMGGAITYRARAEIVTGAGAPVIGGAYEVQYEFRETPAGGIDVFSASTPGAALTFLRTLTDPITGGLLNPAPFIEMDLGPPGGFVLDPGNYTVRYTLEADGLAERQTAPPTVVVDIDTDAKFDIVTFP